MNWNAFSKDQYIETMKSAIGWYLMAKQLMRASHVLLEQMKKDEQVEETESLTSVFMLVSGLALENCIKGIATVRGNLFDLSRMKMALSGSKSGHSELEVYLYDQQIFLSESEKDLLRRLSGYIKRDGRYHVDKEFKNADSQKMRRIYFSPEDPERIDAMYVMLSQYLLRAM